MYVNVDMASTFHGMAPLSESHYSYCLNAIIRAHREKNGGQTLRPHNAFL